MPYQTDLEVGLRDWGLSDYLVLVNGHRTRGSSSFNPGGSVNHHTAGSTSNSIPSLSVLINGHGSLPGPLCNVGQSRSSNFDPKAEFDKIYLIACGRANHAGKGGWQGLVGNSSVFGLEIEHCGDLAREGFSERRQHTAHRVHCAFADIGGFAHEMVCQHKEWAPTRKIDFIGASGTAFRESVVLTALGKGTPTPTPTPIAPTSEEDDNVMQIPAKIVKSDDPNSPHWWVTDGITRQHIPNRTYAGLLINQGIANAQAGSGDMSKTSDIVPFLWPGLALDSVRIVGNNPG